MREVKSVFDVVLSLSHFQDLPVVCSQTNDSLVWLSIYPCQCVLNQFISSDYTATHPRHSLTD